MSGATAMEIETDESATDTTPTTSKSPPSPIDQLVVHPLVLLSAADHYHRVAKGTRKRVVGVLLGSAHRGVVDATNSFAVPFEEDSKNPAVFYLDHNYLENMLAMFRKVNAKERVVGFYSTGPHIRPNDTRIYQVVSKFVTSHSTPPVFCIIDIRPDRPSIPTTCYRVVETTTTTTTTTTSSSNDSGAIQLTFAHVPSTIGAMEAEEVGVEHLLRDINDPTVSTVASLIRAKLAGLDTLVEKLVECKDYCSDTATTASRPMNQEIVGNLQQILNLLPNLNTDTLVESLLVKTNDMHMAIYLAALIRSVLALHDLVNNKIRYNDNHEEEEESSTNKKDEQEEEKKQEEEGDGKNKTSTSTTKK